MKKICKVANQLGRTMLEMLGVLALFGLLSIGAFQLWGTAISRLHANNILEEAQLRSVLGNKTQKVRGIYSTSDFKKGAELTAYGYGIAKNADEVVSKDSMGDTIEAKGYKVIMVPVGIIERDSGSTGKKINVGVCKALLNKVYDRDDEKQVVPGDLIGLYEDKIPNNEITRCETENEEEEGFELPDKIYLAIKK